MGVDDALKEATERIKDAYVWPSFIAITGTNGGNTAKGDGIKLGTVPSVNIEYRRQRERREDTYKSTRTRGSHSS